ncbi:unnamed protein product [Protopolystoma xenopodis]|uniref:Uncharacterized protein n=1 Tax=Protopolystoma xenopodis TaxID=117903 RepID=A0A3S5AZA3_9PLAT|nr:unnamed protein product [Protopolystoma xenopodis]
MISRGATKCHVEACSRQKLRRRRRRQRGQILLTRRLTGDSDSEAGAGQKPLVWPSSQSRPGHPSPCGPPRFQAEIGAELKPGDWEEEEATMSRRLSQTTFVTTRYRSQTREELGPVCNEASVIWRIFNGNAQIACRMFTVE